MGPPLTGGGTLLRDTEEPPAVTMLFDVARAVDRGLGACLVHPVAREFYCRVQRKLAAFAPLNWRGPVMTAGGFTFVAERRDAVQWRVYYTGMHEPTIEAYIYRKLNVGDVYVDVGSNLGYFVLAAAARVGPSGHVFSFEASPAIHAMQRRNLSLNAATNVSLFNKAIAQKPGVVTIFNAGADKLGNSSLIASRGGAPEAQVEAIPLTPDLFGDAVKAIRLIKIDVEGAEAMVVRGMVDLLDHLHPDCDILIEVTPHDMGASPAELLEPFLSRGYGLFEVPSPQQLRDYFRAPYSGPLKPIAPAEIAVMTDVLITRAASPAI